MNGVRIGNAAIYAAFGAALAWGLVSVSGLMAAGPLEGERSDAIVKLAKAESVAALKLAVLPRGAVYVYRDKSWMAIWYDEMVGEHARDVRLYAAVSLDSNGEWLESSKAFSLFYQLPRVNPRINEGIDHLRAEEGSGDPIATMELNSIAIQQLMCRLTNGPDLATARKSLLTAGFAPFDPGPIGLHPRVVVANTEVTAPEPLSPEEAKAMDQLMLLNGCIEKIGGVLTAHKQDNVMDFTDQGMAQLQYWPRLEAIDVGQSRITDAGLRYLTAMSKLRELDVESTGIDDAGMQEIAQLSSLQSLNLAHTAVSDVGLGGLSQLESLKALDLSDNKQITDAGISLFTTLGQLRELDLRGTSLTDAGVRVIGKISQLKVLDLSSTQITDAGLTQIGKMSKLEVLDLSGTQITDAGLPALQSLPNLQKLYLGGTAITAEAFDQFEHLRNLRWLSIYPNRLPHAVIETFRQRHPTITIIDGTN